MVNILDLHDRHNLRVQERRHPRRARAERRLGMMTAGYARVMIVATFALALAGCASTLPEERARAARVRIVKDADAVRGCEAIGLVTDDDIQDLQRKVLRMGGDTALVVTHSQAARGGGGGFGSSTYTTAEVYRCGSRR